MDKLKKFVEYLRKLLKNDKNNKMGENLIILVIIGIIIIIAGSTLFEGEGKKDKKIASNKVEDNIEEKAEEASVVGVNNEKTDLEKSIEEILSQINGVGKVDVLVTYSSGRQIVPYSDVKKSDEITEEKDSTGGTRKIDHSSYESQIAYEDSGSGVKKPIILKELLPEVKGVVVVAEGANDPLVKESLVNAVKVLLDIPVHKIQVFERKGG
ncbi:MAG TPA: stage III sporulation protein AG [Acetivibrio clariflavus]|nr:stage III sporulation protein AG [Acetivibrio clariflavus]